MTSPLKNPDVSQKNESREPAETARTPVGEEEGPSGIVPSSPTDREAPGPPSSSRRTVPSRALPGHWRTRKCWGEGRARGARQEETGEEGTSFRLAQRVPDKTPLLMGLGNLRLPEGGKGE